MYEPIQYQMTKIVEREWLKRAEQARVVRSAVIHRALRKAAQRKTPRAACRRSRQVAY